MKKFLKLVWEDMKEFVLGHKIGVSFAILFPILVKVVASFPGLMAILELVAMWLGGIVIVGVVIAGIVIYIRKVVKRL